MLNLLWFKATIENDHFCQCPSLVKPPMFQRRVHLILVSSLGKIPVKIITQSIFLYPGKLPRKNDFIMDTDWLFQGIIDAEQKQYILLDYFQKLNKDFDEMKIYPIITSLL